MDLVEKLININGFAILLENNYDHDDVHLSFPFNNVESEKCKYTYTGCTKKRDGIFWIETSYGELEIHERDPFFQEFRDVPITKEGEIKEIYVYVITPKEE